MKNNFPGNKFAIYVAERQEQEPSDPQDRWYHTFLMLVDVSSDCPIILQQLHFNDDEKGNLLPNLRKGISDPNRFADVMASSVFAGTFAETMARWNAMSSYALYLGSLNIPFAEDYKKESAGVNCRAAVIASLKHVQIDPENIIVFAETAGVTCNSLPLGSVFNPAAAGEKSLHELTSSNENFFLTLEAKWLRNRPRHVTPLPHPFTPITRQR